SSVIEYLEKTFRASSILDIRPARLADRGHVEAIPRLDERTLMWPKPVARLTLLFDPLVLAPAAVPFLLFLHCGSECNLRKTSSPSLLLKSLSSSSPPDVIECHSDALKRIVAILGAGRRSPARTDR